MKIGKKCGWSSTPPSRRRAGAPVMFNVTTDPVSVFGAERSPSSSSSDGEGVIKSAELSPAVFEALKPEENDLMEALPPVNLECVSKEDEPTQKFSRYLQSMLFEIKNSLVEAVEAKGRKRDKILKRLVQGLCLPVDARMEKKFPVDLETIRKSTKHSTSVASATESKVYFFQLAAEAVCRNPSMAQEFVLHLLIQIWSHPIGPSVFALIYYQQLLWQQPLRFSSLSGPKYLTHLNVWTTGANRLFWTDMLESTETFQPIYAVLEKCLIRAAPFFSRSPSSAPASPLGGPAQVLLGTVSVAEESIWEKKNISNLHEDLLALHATFVFYYYQPGMCDLSSLVQALQAESSYGEILTTSLSSQLPRVKKDSVLIQILTHTTNTLPMLPLNPRSLALLHSAVYSFVYPGGPNYPSAAVQKCASAALNAHFPSGRFPRAVVRLLFSFFHPLSAIWAVLMTLWGWVETFKLKSSSRKRSLSSKHRVVEEGPRKMDMVMNMDMKAPKSDLASAVEDNKPKLSSPKSPSASICEAIVSREDKVKERGS
jgi:hypothetical protein